MVRKCTQPSDYYADDNRKQKLVVHDEHGKTIGNPIEMENLLTRNTLERIKDPVNEYLSASQSGFRPGRSTADVVWGHRWICAISQKFKMATTILGIDMSRAFDTIRRDKLMEILKTILDNDSIRMVRALLIDTELTVKIGPKTVKNSYWHQLAKENQELQLTTIYTICNSRPVSVDITEARWRLLGHILRLDQDVYANWAMESYYAKDERSASETRPRNTLPIVISKNYNALKDN
ncbi:uncharacterized protein LOC115231228 [Octopus sinensis]|uniref:Uncharacterized protein LOC115231228 n=1 Tax=Octopus sinensis TaxID=2607531 RepID=A0A6P7TXJ7_9MOLL|nr:uncharacterized protein LOC115231228 [Octopus sinensis]